MKLRRQKYDGVHFVIDRMPESNVQLYINCDNDNIGGAAVFGDNGKWYWTYDGKISELCQFLVTRWSYL